MVVCYSANKRSHLFYAVSSSVGRTPLAISPIVIRDNPMGAAGGKQWFEARLAAQYTSVAQR